ncbi:MAG: FAD-dependent oxidoreductase [Fimbriimonadales bacterium]
MKETTSLWIATSERGTRPPLLGDSEFDTVIIGAGIVGLSVAYALRGRGERVALIEARRLLNGVTGNTTGKLTSQHGRIYKHLVDTFGKEKSQQYADGNEWAIREVRRIAGEESIDCDYTADTAHIYALDENASKDFEEEVEAAVSLGLPATIVNPDLPFPVHSAIRFDNQARYHPLKYLLGLAVASEREGIQIFENSRALTVEETSGSCRVETEHGVVRACRVVLATHYPIHDSGLFVAKLAPYRSYAMAVDLEGELPTGMYITEGEPMRSFRRQPYQGRDILIVGGEHHKVGQEDDSAACFQRVEAWARSTFPVREVLFRWSTQDNWTPDRLPYVGNSPSRDNIFIATGFGGWGMTNGILAGRIISDAILGKDNAYAEILRPSRMTWGATPKMVSENINSAKYMIGDRLARVEKRELSTIEAGAAAIVQVEDERVAAYRDPSGALHVVTAACTHWGCQVHWNNAEKSWDCPCHGSRFGIDGEVLHGPAATRLEKRPCE